MIGTPEGEVRPCITIPSFITRPVGCRPTVVNNPKDWRGPTHTVAAPLMLVVRLQHLAIRSAAINWFEKVFNASHKYYNKLCVRGDLLALLCPEDIVCLRCPCNLYHERHPSVGREWLRCSNTTAVRLECNKDNEVEARGAEGGGRLMSMMARMVRMCPLACVDRLPFSRPQAVL